MKILIDILIISLFCNGWYLVTRPGMLLFFLHNWYLESCKGFVRGDGETEWIYKTYPSIPRFFYKPLFGCITCMSSIWGTLVYFVINNFTLSWMWPIVIIGASFGNLLMHSLLEKLYSD